MNASITDIHIVNLPGNINSYKVNKRGEYWTHVLQIFLTTKMPCSGRQATAYTVSVAVLTFKVIQGK